jgi:hypothetical protein
MYKIIGADQKEYGPISAEQVRAWMAENRINGETKILVEGTTVWKRVADLPEFASILPPPPMSPGVPPVAPMGGPTLAPGSPRPMYMAPAPAKTNQLALWAMITGIFGVLCCQIIAPLSIILGFVAHSQIKKNPAEKGSGMATTGIVLGFLALLVLIATIIMYAAMPQVFQNFPGLTQ